MQDSNPRNGVTTENNIVAKHLQYASTRPGTIHMQGHEKAADSCIANSHRIPLLYTVMVTQNLGRNGDRLSGKTGINRRVDRVIPKTNLSSSVRVGESYHCRTPLLIILQFSNHGIDCDSRVDSNN